MYNAPGNLLVAVGKSSFSFDVEIERKESDEISSMEIFCYDLMLAHLWANQYTSPHILIYDSILFDPVDPRQVAAAIELAADESYKVASNTS